MALSLWKRIRTLVKPSLLRCWNPQTDDSNTYQCLVVTVRHCLGQSLSSGRPVTGIVERARYLDTVHNVFPWWGYIDLATRLVGASLVTFDTHKECALRRVRDWSDLAALIAHAFCTSVPSCTSVADTRASAHFPSSRLAYCAASVGSRFQSRLLEWSTVSTVRSRLTCSGRDSPSGRHSPSQMPLPSST